MLNLLFRNGHKDRVQPFEDGDLKSDPMVGVGVVGFQIGFGHSRISFFLQSYFHCFVYMTDCDRVTQQSSACNPAGVVPASREDADGIISTRCDSFGPDIFAPIFQAEIITRPATSGSRAAAQAAMNPLMLWPIGTILSDPSGIF